MERRSLLQLVDLVGAVLADVVLLVVHADDAPVHGEERSVEAARHRPVEVLTLVFRHVKHDVLHFSDLVQLQQTRRPSLQRSGSAVTNTMSFTSAIWFSCNKHDVLHFRDLVQL